MVEFFGLDPPGSRIMGAMRTAAAALLGISLIGLAVSTYLYVWPGEAPAPRWIPAPAPVAIDPKPAFPLSTRAVEVRRGETLARTLTRAGLDARAANELAAQFGKNGADLRKLRTGASVEIVSNFRNELVTVRYEASPWMSFAARAIRGGWQVGRAETIPDVRVEAVRGVVQRSLFDAVEKSGESARLVLEMVEIFSSDFDFTADTRAGDRFRLLVEKRYAGDTFVDYGRILVAQYASGGKILTGVGIEQASRYGHYDLAGQSLRKSFLKSPLEFSRITSGFTYARPHPILGGVRPHLAIDYAAPVGTPVRAVADGVVVRAGWNGGNGIQVHLRHRSGFETQYNHLSRVGNGIRPGARVKQKQIIGSVGATGLATGPHLDYRVARHGTFVNPLSEKFIPGEPISPSARPDFQRHAREILARLEATAPF
jgi:murein DD-endopeptidase MepM/ murein hydrolase activator NlpD